MTFGKRPVTKHAAALPKTRRGIRFSVLAAIAVLAPALAAMAYMVKHHYDIYVARKAAYEAVTGDAELHVFFKDIEMSKSPHANMIEINKRYYAALRRCGQHSYADFYKKSLAQRYALMVDHNALFRGNGSVPSVSAFEDSYEQEAIKYASLPDSFCDIDVHYMSRDHKIMELRLFAQTLETIRLLTRASSIH